MTESFAGEPVEADVAGMQTELDSSPVAWSGHLKIDAESSIRPRVDRTAQVTVLNSLAHPCVATLATRDLEEIARSARQSRLISDPDPELLGAYVEV